MKNKILSWIFLLFLLSNNTIPFIYFAYSFDKEKAWKILDNFKQLEYEMIFEENTVIADEDLDLLDITNKTNLYESIKQNIHNKRLKLEEEKKEIVKNINSLEDTIKALTEDIEETQKNIKILKIKIQVSEKDIEISKREISKINEKIVENRATINKYIIHIYKNGNLIYSDKEEVDSIKAILLNEDGLASTISDIHFKTIIELTGRQLITRHRQLIKDLFVKKFAYEKWLKEFEWLKKEEEIEETMLAEKKELKWKLLDISKSKDQKYEEYIKERLSKEKTLSLKIIEEKLSLDEKEREVMTKYGCNTEEKENDEKCRELKKVLELESKLRNTILDTKWNVLNWPVLPEKGISSYYNDNNYKAVLGSTHDAIDIVIPQGTDIKSPQDGYVLYLQPPLNEWYAYIALKHDNGFVTVYGHVNEVLVEKHDFVKAWDVFAKSGWAIGTKWAWYLTTWAHLHMEVIKDKQYKDPLAYMDLTVLGLSNLPHEKYVYKYQEDFEAKEWYFDDLSKFSKKIFTLQWDDEIARQKYLISTYAAPDFRNWSIWVEEATEWKIDPSFLMCVWLAETGLGNNLKTRYNIWNIWNTDSWATSEFRWPRDGIYRMVKTLNNQYLGDYTKLEELSRYGNKAGKIYASSSDNWHNNIIKCISALKKQHIPDDYNFRIE